MGLFGLPEAEIIKVAPRLMLAACCSSILASLVNNT